MIYVVLTIVGVIVVAVAALAPLFLLLYLGEHALNAAPFGRFARFLLVALKSLRRNLLRTTLTYLATFVLVVVIVMVWSVLHFLGELTSEKAKDLKIIVSEKYQMGSQMPFSYAGPLSEGAARSDHAEDTRPQDSMTWQFYVGTLDPAKTTREDLVFFIALEPRRSSWSFALSRQLWAIGCNRVTRHDAPVSVRAGFSGNELSRLWPQNGKWRLQERPAGWFSHLFLARREV